MTATPKRDSLTKRIGQLRQHGQVVEALVRGVRKHEDDARLLAADSPYRRPCNLCAVRGSCEHREPMVELAYAEVKARRRVT